MIDFSVELSGLDEERDRIIEDSKEVLFLSMNKMMNLSKQKCPVDTGELRRSIHLSPKTKGAKEYVLADGVFYGIFVEFGTQPHHPPVGPLLTWSKRVLGNEKAGYAIAKKIAKEGTSAHPYFRPALLEVKEQWVPHYWNTVMGRH